VQKPKTRDEIVEAIERIANFRGAWSIGSSDDPSASRDGQGSPRFWYHWSAGSETVARDVIDHFTNRGMSLVQENGSGQHVFIFLPYRPKFRRPSAKAALSL
jgi:hypothetical protein